jgi:hypothetical protein
LPVPPLVLLLVLLDDVEEDDDVTGPAPVPELPADAPPVPELLVLPAPPPPGPELLEPLSGGTHWALALQR